MRNPFLSHAAGTDLDRDRADVADIHAASFRKVHDLIDEVRQNQITQAMLLFGEPGSGKTHLLGRLERWLDERARGGELAVFVPIRMAVSSRMLWRLIREHLAGALLKRLPQGPRLLQSALRRPVEEIAETHRDLGRVLERLLQGTNVADAAAWLKGHDLPPTALEELGLASARDEEDLEASSERMVRALCDEVSPAPVVFCFDQLESIQSHAGDKTGFRQFGNVLSTLYDSCHNLVLLSCVQTALINELESGMRDPDKQRLLQRRAALNPLKWDEICRLCAARLDTLPELAEERSRHPNPVWPLDAEKLRSFFPGDGRLLARKGIVRGYELFEAWQGRAAEVQQTLDQFFEQDLQARIQPMDPQQSDRILRTGLAALLQLRGLPFAAPDPKRDSVLEGTVGGTALAVCNQDSRGSGLARRLAKIIEEYTKSGAEKILLFRDARKGIGRQAVSTQKLLAALRAKGGELVSVQPEALAALNACNELLADVRSGDLAYRGDSVPVPTLEQWLTQHLPAPLDDLLDSLGSPSVADPLPALTELVNEGRVVRLEEVARQLGIAAEEVESVARRNPALFGFAGGNTRVLYRAVQTAGAG